jgi:hypothetical protein
MVASDDLLRLDIARWRLALIWFGGCAFFFLLLVAQSLGGAYGTQVQRAWALPTFMPTLALMTSVFAADAMKPATGTRAFVRRGFTNLSVGLSIFYIIVLFVSVLVQPFAAANSGAADIVTARLELLELSNLWLAPLQSIVVGALGVLFFLKQDDKTKKS